MINKKIVFAVLVLLLFINTSSASLVYTCCKSFTTSEGTLMDSFYTGWDNGTVNTSVYIDNSKYVEGNSSLNISTKNNSASGYSTKTVDIQLSNYSTINFWLYIPNMTTFYRVQLYLSTSPTLATSYSKYFYNTSMVEGWNYVSSNISAFTKNGNENLSNKTIRIRFTLFPNGMTNTSASVDYMTFDPIRRAKFIFTFDDYSANVSTLIYPILEANGQKAQAGVVEDWVGTTDADGTYANLSQSLFLLNHGWDVTSHSKTHPTDMRAISDAALISETNDSYDYLLANGLGLKDHTFIYPHGLNDERVRDQVKTRYVMARSAVSSGINFQSSQFYSFSNQRYNIIAYNAGAAATVTNYKAWINETVNNSGLMVLVLHEVVNGTGDANNISDTNVKAISDYLVSRSASIDVITFTDMLIVTDTDTQLYKNSQQAGSQLIQFASIILGGVLIAVLALVIIARMLKTELDITWLKLLIAIIIILIMLFIIAGS